MNIKRVPISEVEVWDKNPRNIKTKDFERLKRQIQELGVYKPLICVKENGKYTTLGGNMRLKALVSLNLKEVDISLVDAPDEATKIKYALSDNDRVGGYDEQALAELTYPHIEEINLEDYRIDVGEPISLKDVIEDYAPDVDGEDEVQEIDDSPAITKMGDLFMLGKHRLLCGDATKEEDVKRLMGGEKADMVFTDPPYGVSYADKNTFLNTIDKGNRIQERIVGDHQEVMDMKKLWVTAFSLLFNYSKKGACYYICSPQGGELMMMMMSILEAGWELKHCLIWVKNNHVLGRSDYHYKHEPLLYGWKEGGHKFYGGKGEVSTWFIDKPQKSELHPIQKPLALILRAIKNSSKPDQIINDFFLGSGSSLIACEKLNRICYGMEIEPKYCNVIIIRYASFTDIPEEEIRSTRSTDG